MMGPFHMLLHLLACLAPQRGSQIAPNTPLLMKERALSGNH